MTTVGDTRSAVLAAAAGWAKARGLASVARIPPEQAAAVVQDVAAQTGLPPAAVREALVRHWSAQNDRAARSLSDLGAAPAYQGGADHRPLQTVDGMRPIAALLAQKAAAQRAEQPRVGVVRAPVDAFAAADRLLSQKARRELKAAFGDEGARFFDWPSTIGKIAAGAPIVAETGGAGALVDRFVADVGAAAGAPGVSNAARNALFAARDEVAGLLRDAIERPSPQAFGLLFEALAPLVEDLAKDRGVFLKAVATGELGATTFRAMRPGERALEQLKIDDPAAWAVVANRRRVLAEHDAQVQAIVAREGLDASKARILGALVTVGVDRATGEKVVFSPQHGALPIDRFVAERKRFLAEQKALRDAPPALVDGAKKLDFVDPAKAKLEGPVRWASLTDDLAKDDPLTRVYAVRTHAGRDLVVEGKFAGRYLDDLVDQAGRLVEGRAWSLDPATGRASERPLDAATVDREPYATATTVTVRGRPRPALQLSLPNAQGEWTDVRRGVRELSKRVPSIRYEEGSKNTRFTFEAKDLAAVREVLGGIALSSGAVAQLRAYFEDLAAVERATTPESLAAYSAEAIGGFRSTWRTSRGEEREFKLSPAQLEAIAKLDAQGGAGVVSLDTGMGKTLVAIATMQKALRDASPAEAAERRFLWVCPPALRGNLAKEVHRWLEPAAAEALLARVDVMSYGAFREASKSGRRGFDATKFHTVFFDEAQALKDPRSETTKAALKLDHPRKVPMTASFMEKTPMEAPVLGAIASNLDLGHPVHGKEARRELRKFRERFLETVGGRVVGLKSDPLVRRDHDVWTRRNVIYAGKLDPTSSDGLRALETRTETVAMSPEVERAYRAAAKDLARAMQGMVKLYRDHGLIDGDGAIDPRAKDPKIADVLGIGLRDVLKKLNELQNIPGKHVPGAGAPKIERAGDVIAERVARSSDSRALLFADDRELVLKSAQELSAQPRFAGKIFAACLNDKIFLFKNGKPVDAYQGHRVPFEAKPYRRDMAKPSNKTDNRHFQKAAWQQFVLGELLGNDRDVVGMAMLGQTYQTGQNLQQFDTVIHLDRDTWNSEDMRQRTARAWRQGQDDAVLEVTIDAVFTNPRDDVDATLDEVRRHHQLLHGALFDAVVKGAQTATLGSEWLTIDARKASFVKLHRDTLALMTSPTAARSTPPGNDDDVHRAA